MREMEEEEEDPFNPFGMGGMPGRVMIVETVDSNGNVLRRAIPARGNVFGPTLSRGGSIGGFLELISLLARRQREREEDQGLTREEIEGLSRIQYHSSGEKDLCTICYCEFEEEEKVISLRCKHLYHEECIVKWLEKNAKCPVCKRPQTDRPIRENDD